MKLELKHLAPYLPYKLKIYQEQQESKIDLMIGLFLNSIDFLNWSPIDGGSIELYKPIIRPLSDLTKEMAKDCGYPTIEQFLMHIRTKTVTVEIWEDLLNNHYDVFGLIDKGLAITKSSNN